MTQPLFLCLIAVVEHSVTSAGCVVDPVARRAWRVQPRHSFDCRLARISDQRITGDRTIERDVECGDYMPAHRTVRNVDGAHKIGVGLYGAHRLNRSNIWRCAESRCASYLSARAVNARTICSMFERHSSALAQHSQSGVSQFIGCRPFRVADRGVTADTIRSVMLP
jgi:hypothetical protein